MSHPESTPPDEKGPSPVPPLDDPKSRDAMARSHAHNFRIVSLYHIVLRTGWIFKIESVVVPAVLDSIGGSAALRGWLPLLNRFAMSLPPVFFARRLRGMSQKKWALFGCSACMASAFLLLAAIWWFVDVRSISWMPLVFLVIYTFFFFATGMNQVALGTLQGKLIYAQRRGRLMAVATVVGVVVAATAAALFMPRWLEADHVRFEYLFAFTGVMFLISAGIATMLSEPADRSKSAGGHPLEQLAATWRVLRDDANFRLLAVVALLFGTTMIAFPHYLALAREKLNLKTDNIVIWVIVQNVGTAIISMAAGPLADRRGTRLAVRVLTVAAACVPLVAVGLALVPSVGRWMYSLVFALIGLTPITYRMLTNYTLEVTQPENHPRYLGTLALCLALPCIASPLVGRLVDARGYEPVFCGISALALLGWFLSVRLIEPRDHQPPSAEELSVLSNEG